MDRRKSDTTESDLACTALGNKQSRRITYHHFKKKKKKNNPTKTQERLTGLISETSVLNKILVALETN